MPSLAKPRYTGTSSKGIALAVEDMKRHTTDEGWQIMAGLEEAGYPLYGFNLGESLTDVNQILAKANPGIVVVQDKREWDVARRDFREKRAKFNNVRTLSRQSDIFKVTILKDSHQRPDYHKMSAEEISCHAWIVYYDPDRVAALAPFVRKEHLIRTYHTLNPDIIPEFSMDGRKGTIISGAVSSAYPLRMKLVRNRNFARDVDILHHPGYHRMGCNTPNFVHMLSRYKVSVCTASMYGYALRKMMESAACGCRIVTDLPENDDIPVLDKYLIRVRSTANAKQVLEVCQRAEDEYDPELQEQIAQDAMAFYDYKAMGIKLAADIETLREGY